MGTSNSGKIKLGIFVILGLACFIVGIYLIGSKENLFSKNFRVNAIFKNVTGLMVGNNVRYTGINVGTIESIQLVNDTSVKVVMIVDTEVQKFIKKDATASIGNEGLMGNKLVNISPGTYTQPVVQNEDFLRTTQPIDIDEILKAVKATAENAAHITSDLALITHNLHTGKSAIGKLLTDTVFGETLEGAVGNIEKGTYGFSQNMEALKENFLFKSYYKRKEKEREELLKKKDPNYKPEKKRKWLFFKNKDGEKEDD